MLAEARDFLDGYPADVRAIALKLRQLVLAALPEATEQVDRPARMLAYGRDATYQGLVCVIMPQKGYVNLGFARGASLPDPDGLLEGTGKRARHVKVRSLAQAEAAGIRRLLAAAVKASPLEGADQR
jgi:hypothetical protein